MYLLSLIFLAMTFGLLYAGKQNPVLKKVAVLPALFVIGLGIFALRPAQAPTIEDTVIVDTVLGQIIGERILAEQPGGGGVAIVQLRPGDPDKIMQEIPEAQLRGLHRSLGGAYTLYVVDATRIGKEDISRPQGGLVRRSSDFKQMLSGYTDLVAVVSFAGLPIDPYNLQAMGLPPFYGVLSDVLPPAWQTELPAGIAGIVSIRPDDPWNTLPDPKTAPLEIFEKSYIMTPSNPAL